MWCAAAVTNGFERSRHRDRRRPNTGASTSRPLQAVTSTGGEHGAHVWSKFAEVTHKLSMFLMLLQAYLHQFDVNPNSRLELDDFMHLVNNLRVREKSANSGPRSQARPLPATLACPGPTHPSSGSLQSLTHEQASLSAEQHHARVTAVAARVEAALKDEAKAELR